MTRAGVSERLAAQKAEAVARFCALEPRARRAHLAFHDERIAGRIYAHVAHLASCARLCEETNMPTGLPADDDAAEDVPLPLASGQLFDCFTILPAVPVESADHPGCVVLRCEPVLHPKRPALDDPARFLALVESHLPDFLASPHRRAQPQATYWRLVSKTPQSWEALDRSLALLVEQRMLTVPDPNAVDALPDEPALEKLVDSPVKEKKKKKKKKKSDKGLETPSTTASQVTSMEDTRTRWADLSSDSEGEDKPFDNVTIDTGLTTPCVASPFSCAPTTAGCTSEGIPSSSRVADCLSTASGMQSVSSPAAHEEVSGSSSMHQMQGVTPAHLVSMVWNGLAQDCEAADSDGWCQVRPGRRGSKGKRSSFAEAPETQEEEHVSLGHPAVRENYKYLAALPEDASLGHPDLRMNYTYLQDCLAPHSKTRPLTTPGVGEGGGGEGGDGTRWVGIEDCDVEYPDTDEELYFGWY